MSWWGEPAFFAFAEAIWRLLVLVTMLGAAVLSIAAADTKASAQTPAAREPDPSATSAPSQNAAEVRYQQALPAAF